MPISLRWHETSPILLMTYSGSLNPADFEDLCVRRDEMLAAGPAACVVVADVCELAALPPDLTARPGSTIVRHSKVRQTVIGLPADL